MHIVVIHKVMRGYKDEGGVYQGSSSGLKGQRQDGIGTMHRDLANLDETDGSRFFTKTLTTEVKTILAYYPCLVGAQTAEEDHMRKSNSLEEQPNGIIPLARTLSVFSGTREPNGVVCHGGIISEVAVQ